MTARASALATAVATAAATAVAVVLLSRSLLAIKKTTPPATVAAAPKTTTERDPAEDDAARGGGGRDGGGGASSPPPPPSSTPPATSASATESTSNDDDGGAFLLPRDGSLVGTTVVEHRDRPSSSSSSAGGQQREGEGIREEERTEEEENREARILSRGTITIAYSSTTGTCEGYARRMHGRLSEALSKGAPSSNVASAAVYRRVRLVRAGDVDWWDEMTNDYDEGGDPDGGDDGSNDKSRWGPPILLFVLPTWTDGTLPPDSATLLASLNEILHDWRVAPEPLRTSDPDGSTLRVGAFGMGSSGYDPSTVGRPARDVFALLVGKLGARPLISRSANIARRKRGGARMMSSLAIGDSESGDSDAVFDGWMGGVVSSIFPSAGADVDGEGGGNAIAGGVGARANGGGKKNGARKSADDVRDEEEKDERRCGANDDGEGGDNEKSSACACKGSDGDDKGKNANYAATAAAGCCSSDNGTDSAAAAGCCSSNDGVPKNATPGGEEDDYSANDPPSSEEEDEEDDDDDDDDDDDGSEGGGIVDVEDMGDVMKEQSTSARSKEPLEMVTPKQAKALKKEGYRLIGTHSAVKLCRWTKHQLRGRGGCYKHTHYGITSYQCMEATPSLACANKCVFCWRHHKNPVGKEWRWKTDDPMMIVEEAVKEHVSMIKETRGIPGIRMDRWQEAHTVKHCALSLVGEPIMYPRINELLSELHERKISTFLVTNGQHPKAIEDLIPITQLYVSVDASTPESLEAIDRPLFNDAWERLRASLTCLKRKGQRTVARLTVVKGWNSDDIGGYARLIALGHCSLVEVKGVTFCGKSDASNLNMTNTPWHHEVVEFSRLLLEEMRVVRAEGGEDPLPEYDLACEHKHSCSVLLARVDQFAVTDPDDPGKRKWRTWIDYDKFQLLAARRASDPTFVFGVGDYVADTPSWAVFGADEEGFDPTDNRHRKKTKHPKYARFDADGVPTHDTFDEPLSADEMSRLVEVMDEKKMQIGDATTVTELRGGEKVIDDASLMFRGLVVTR